ncbi:MAG: ribosome-associated translation inhibitor RaiA [Candidatus Komeilibacteria bacterium]
MNKQLYSKNTEITEPLRVYIEERLDRLDHLNSEIMTGRVDISRDQHHRKGDIFRVEINLNLRGKLLRVVETRPDAREAIDLVTEKLARQLRDLKNKKLFLRRLGGIFQRK